MANIAVKMRSPEAAAYLRMAVSTLTKLRCRGGGPRFAKVGPRLVVYDRADLDAWLKPNVRVDLGICHAGDGHLVVMRATACMQSAPRFR